MTINQQQAVQIEKFGVTLEQTGFPPLAARIMSLLLVAEPPYCSFEEIMEGIQSSKSSVSTSLNLLLNEGVVNYKTFPGDRKRYFQVNKETWLRMLKRKVDQIEPFRNILLELTRTRSDAYPEFNKMLLEMSELHAEIEEAMMKIIDRWIDKNS